MADSATRPTGAGQRRDRRSGAGSPVLDPPSGVPAVPDLPTAIPAQREDSPSEPVAPPSPPARPAVVDPCVCGHAKEAHEHYRRGTDCGVCGATACATFRREGPVPRMRSGLRPPG
jgi:hypothetical protein